MKTVKALLDELKQNISEKDFNIIRESLDLFWDDLKNNNRIEIVAKVHLLLKKYLPSQNKKNFKKFQKVLSTLNVPDVPLELEKTYIILEQLPNNFIIDLIDALSKERTNKQQQEELFPLLKLQKNVELKKEFALNFGGLDRIEKDFKHLLTVKLSSGKTLQQYIDKVKDWFNSLYGENLGNWIKLFAFVKAVDTNEGAKLYEIKSGYYKFSIKQDKNFFSLFIRPDKKSGQFTTKAKKKILKWLYDNQSTIEFPLIINNEVWNVPIKIYEYAENISTREIYFIVNTNILESEFRDYISIEVNEIDAINEAWETIAEQNPAFSRTGYRLNNFIDIPLKFLLTLKQIYSEGGNFTTKDGYHGNTQRLTKENFNAHLGNLSERIKKHLQTSNKGGTKKSNVMDDVTKLLIMTTFDIALQRKWLMSEPKIENGIWIFNINPGYFAKKATALKLKKL